MWYCGTNQWATILYVSSIFGDRELCQSEINFRFRRKIAFSYPIRNFCYRCGLLEHDLKDCTQKKEIDKTGNMGEFQYGAWMKGEPVRKSGWDPYYAKRNEGVGVQGRIPEDDYRSSKAQMPTYELVGTDNRKLVVQSLGDENLEGMTLA